MRQLIIATLVAVLANVATEAAAQSVEDVWRTGARVSLVSDGYENVRAAGALVSVRGTVREDLWAAGAEVDIDTITRGEAMIIGALVTVRGEVHGNLGVAGARVDISALIGGGLDAAGGRVLIGREVDVRGAMRLAGANVVFAGVANGPAEIHADSVRVDGQIGGDVVIRARAVEIGPTAVIDGDVTFETLEDPVIDAGATIGGQRVLTGPRPGEAGDLVRVLAAVALFAVGAGFVLGLVLLMTMRPFVERTIAAIREAPVRSGFVGLAVLILAPAFAIVLMATVVGMPVALLAMLAFPLIAMTASVAAALGVADWLLNRRRYPSRMLGRLAQLLFGLLVLTVVGLVPVLGFITWMLALFVGLGAVWYAARNVGPARMSTLPP